MTSRYLVEGLVAEEWSTQESDGRQSREHGTSQDHQDRRKQEGEEYTPASTNNKKIQTTLNKILTNVNKYSLNEKKQTNIKQKSVRGQIREYG